MNKRKVFRANSKLEGEFWRTFLAHINRHAESNSQAKAIIGHLQRSVANAALLLAEHESSISLRTKVDEKPSRDEIRNKVRALRSLESRILDMNHFIASMPFAWKSEASSMTNNRGDRLLTDVDPTEPIRLFRIFLENKIATEYSKNSARKPSIEQAINVLYTLFEEILDELPTLKAQKLKPEQASLFRYLGKAGAPPMTAERLTTNALYVISPRPRTTESEVRKVIRRRFT